MAQITEKQREEALNVIRSEPAIMDMLNRAGLGRADTFTQEYFMRNLAPKVAEWIQQGKDPRVGVANWLTERLHVAEEKAKQAWKDAPNFPIERKQKAADEYVRHMKAREAMEKKRDELSAGPSYASDQRNRRQYDEILGAVGRDVERTKPADQRDLGERIAQTRSAMASMAARGEETQKPNTSDSRAAEAPKAQKPAAPKAAAKQTPIPEYVIANVLSDPRYGVAIQMQNRTFEENKKGADDLVRDAMRVAVANGKTIDLGPGVTPEYAQAVNQYAKKLNGYANNPRLGPNHDARMIAGLNAENKAAQRQAANMAAEQEAQTRKAREQEGKTYVYNLDIPSLATGSEADKDSYGFSVSRGQSFRLVSSKPLKTWEVGQAIRSDNPQAALAALGVTAVGNNHNPNQKPDEVYGAVKFAYDSPDPLAGFPTLAEQKPAQPKQKRT
jgi:hypothetical protein